MYIYIHLKIHVDTFILLSVYISKEQFRHILGILHSRSCLRFYCCTTLQTQTPNVWWLYWTLSMILVIAKISTMTENDVLIIQFNCRNSRYNNFRTETTNKSIWPPFFTQYQNDYKFHPCKIHKKQKMFFFVFFTKNQMLCFYFSRTWNTRVLTKNYKILNLVLNNQSYFETGSI